MMTPTDADGRLAMSVIRDHAAALKSHGVHGIMALGTTGEFPLLSVETRLEFLDVLSKHSSGVPILANVSDASPRGAFQLSRRAKEIGAIGVAILPPYYYAISQQDLGEFFVRVAEVSGLPVWLYNFPERTGTRIELETIAWVADRVPMVGIKQSGGDFGYHKDLVKLGREKGYSVFTGADPRLAETMALGARGCIGGMGNAVGDIKVGLFDAVEAGDAARAEVFTQQLKTIAARIDVFPFPLNIAAMMEARGLPIGHPKTIHAPSTWAGYKELVADLRAIYQQIGLR